MEMAMPQQKIPEKQQLETAMQRQPLLANEGVSKTALTVRQRALVVSAAEKSLVKIQAARTIASIA